MTLQQLQKEARDRINGDCPNPECNSCEKEGVLIDTLTATAYQAGKDVAVNYIKENRFIPNEYSD